MNLTITNLTPNDINEIVEAFHKIGWNKPATIFETYLAEEKIQERTNLVARVDGVFAGYVTLKWRSAYQSFNQNDIPEMKDLNVLPKFRKQGVATQLIEYCEQLAREAGKTHLGLAVGLTKDYGDALRLYIKLGFINDGLGIAYNNRHLSYGETTVVDDELGLHFAKQL